MLYDNFQIMQNNGIKLQVMRNKTEAEWEAEVEKMRRQRLPEIHIPKKPFPKIPVTKTCNSQEDIQNAYTYCLTFPTFPNEYRISFLESGVTTSDGDCINGYNASQLYKSDEFATNFTAAIQRNDPQLLSGLLQTYKRQDNEVLRNNLRQNLYRKDRRTGEYKHVEKNYNLDNFFQSAVNKYNNNNPSQNIEIRTSKNPSEPGKIYNKFQYDRANGRVNYSDMYQNALFYQDMHEREQRNRFNQLREYDPKLWNYEINFRRPLYFIDYGSYLVPVYPSL